jgi:PncC family amidohydrolase
MKSLTDLSDRVAQLLKQRGETVAVAETSTGGLISSALLAVPGASDYYQGGSVVYTIASRKLILGIDRSDVEGLEPMTQAMAMRFAEVARNQLDTTWAVAELGIAGPAGAPYGVNPGTSVIALDGPNRLSITVTTGSNDREANMWAFTAAAFDLFSEALESS